MLRFSRRRSASDRFGFLGWLALGAGVASLGLTLFDPTRGAARRAAIRDRTTSAAKSLGSRTRSLGARTRGRLLDTSSRMRGRIQAMRARLSDGSVSDAIIEERIRAQIGRIVSHPGALRVSATRGCVEITGPVLAKEAEELVERIRGVRGVKDVVERLEVHEEAASEPSFQEIANRRERTAGFAG
jgi:osmotically-inducible protein OsmY